MTAQVTRETAIIQADHALRALENATRRIGRALTADAGTTPPSPELARALAAADAAHPELLAAIAARSPAEPYRTYLLFLAERLRATRERDADLAYGDPAEFLADLRLVQDALASAGAPRQAFGELQHLIWQAETFGFHLAELEVRQHSEVHARALAELDSGGELSDQTQEVLATFRVIAWIQGRFGPQACRRYVVSFTRSAADVAAVYELARRAAGGRPGGGPRRGPAVRERRRPGQRSARARRHAEARASSRPPGPRPAESGSRLGLGRTGQAAAAGTAARSR